MEQKQILRMLDICKHGKLGMYATIITMCQTAIKEGNINTFIEYNDYYEICQLYFDLEPFEMYERALEVGKIIEVLNLLKTLSDHYNHQRTDLKTIDKIKKIIFTDYCQSC